MGPRRWSGRVTGRSGHSCRTTCCGASARTSSTRPSPASSPSPRSTRSAATPSGGRSASCVRTASSSPSADVRRASPGADRRPRPRGAGRRGVQPVRVGGGAGPHADEHRPPARPGGRRRRRDLTPGRRRARARAGNRDVHGIDMISFDDDGLIVTFEVMVRPASGLQALARIAEAAREAAVGLRLTRVRERRGVSGCAARGGPRWPSRVPPPAAGPPRSPRLRPCRRSGPARRPAGRARRASGQRAHPPWRPPALGRPPGVARRPPPGRSTPRTSLPSQ